VLSVVHKQTGWQELCLTSLLLFQLNERLAAVISLLVETLAAINRSAFTGFKRYFRLFATFGTNGRVHLAGFTATHALGFPVLAASRATLWFVSIAFGLEELLFGSSEGERSPAIGTCKLFILESHG